MTNSWLNDYKRDGYFFPVDVLEQDECASMRAALEDAEARLGPTNAYPHLVMPWLNDLMRRDVIVDRVSEILGPNLLVWNTSFFIKEPQSTSYVSWHQDLHYWGLDDVEEVTAWVALSPANVESGCMRFVPGTHLHDDVPHQDTFSQDNLLSRGQELAVDVSDEAAVDVVLEPGQMSLHHGRMFHASHKNSSSDRRIGVAIRYITPAMRQSNGTRTVAVLVRGEDTHNHFDLAPPPSGNLEPADLERAMRARKLADQILYDNADKEGRKTL